MATILDQFGRVVEYFPQSAGLFAESTEDTRYRASRPRLDYDIATMLPKWRHRLLISDARYIATTFPIVAGAVQQKSDYVSGAGWKGQFEGEDTEWGEQAEKVLAEADTLCDLRGFPFDFAKNMWIGCGLYDVDGDWSIYKTERKDMPGFPAFQFLEAHRIGTRTDFNGRVMGGDYDGAVILNGIIYDDNGAEIAYNLLGYRPEDDEQIPAKDMIHAMDPRWFSEGRSLPSIAYAVLDWYDVKEIRAAEKIAQKANASISIIEENGDGKRPINNVVGSTAVTTAGGMQTELMEAGMIRYIKSGNKLTAHTAQRPSEGAAKFDRTLVAGAFYGMGWRSEMMDLSQLTGAGVRGFQDNINTTIFSRWNTLAKVAKVMRLYQVAKLIDRGDLPEHPEWMKWGHAQPPEFTVDPGRTSQADRDNVRAGVDSMPAVIRKTGRDFEDVLREQARYEKAKQRIAKEEGVDPIKLGTLALPGDQLPEAAPAAQNQQEVDE